MSASSAPTRRSYIETNTRHACDTPACRTVRYGMSRYCKAHRRRNAKFGSPVGYAIQPRHVAVEYARCSAFLDKYATSPNVIAALKFLREKWLVKAPPQPTGAERERARLAFASVEPMVILKVGAALYLYSMKNPRTLPDGRELTYALSRRVSGLVPHVRSVFVPMQGTVVRKVEGGEKARREVGESLREVLAIFWLNVVAALDRDDASVAQEASDLRAAFDIPLRTTEASTTEAVPGHHLALKIVHNGQPA